MNNRLSDEDRACPDCGGCSFWIGLFAVVLMGVIALSAVLS